MSELETFVNIISKITQYQYGTDEHKYTRVSGPIEYLHVPTKNTLKLWNVDFEPGDAWFRTRWEAFDYYGAEEFANIWIKLENSYYKKSKYDWETPLSDKDIPTIIKMIESAEIFGMKNKSYVNGPWTTLSNNSDKFNFFWNAVVNNADPIVCPSLASAFDTLGFTKEAELIDKYNILKNKI